MTTVAPPLTDTNPFVGPRSFSRNEKLYGRDREIRELLDLVVADRVVLCYSPSGAGKTSLIQAGLTPRLEDEGFLVLPTVRLRHEPPNGSVNRYVASALASLGVPSDDPATTLHEGLGRVPVAEDRTGVLVFDQFEELLSLDPTDTDAKRRFFVQLGEVLRDRRWWALFAMREDFLAALDPYLPLLPTRLATRFRLDLLGTAAAREVVTRTAASAGRTFADEASAALVTELSRLAGSRTGPYVEPVQLQVVCRRLWERLPPDVTEITTEVMGDVGDVDGALASYYAQEVAEASALTGVAERTIREWFECELVSDGGFRGQAQTGPGGDDRVVRLLQDAHLVRSEPRRGTTWYELAHDRLVPPVLADNRAWAEEHLSVFQRQAALWDQEGRRDGLLVADEILDEGEALAGADAEALSESERAFLDACRRVRAAAERERESARRTRRLLAAATVGLVVALVASAVAFWSYTGARRARDRAEAGERLRLAAPAVDLVDVDPNLSAHLALRALDGSDVVEDDAGRDAQEVLLRRIVDAARIGMTVPARGVRRLAFSPDGGLLAVLGDDGVAVWGDGRWENEASGDTGLIALAFSPDGGRVVATDGLELVVSSSVGEEGTDAEELGSAGRQKTAPVADLGFTGDGRLVVVRSDSSGVRLGVSSGPGSLVPGTDAPVAAGRVRAVELSGDSSTMATAADDGAVRLWEVRADGGAPAARELRLLRGHGGPVGALAFSADGRYLATGGDDGAVRVWDTGSDGPGRTVAVHDGAVRTVAFGADGASLASGGVDGTVRVVDRATGRERLRADPRTGPVTSVDFHPSGDRLAIATEDGAPAVWDVAVQDAGGHEGAVYDAAFDGAGGRVATASADGTAAIWDVDGNERSVLNGHGDEVNAVEFLPGGSLATASDDGTAKIWNTTTATEERTFAGHTDLVYDVAVSPEGARLATAAQDGTARIWDVAAGGEARLVLDARDPLSGVAFSPDGRLLATAGESDARIWDAASGQPGRGLRAGEHEGPASRVAFSPDGRSVAASLEDGAAVWDVATGELRGFFDAPHGAVFPILPGVAFSADGTRLAMAGAVVELATGRRIASLPPVNGVAFHPGGAAVVTAGDGTTATIHDATDGRALRSLGTEATGPETVAAVDSDLARGRLVTASGRTVTLWDTAGRALRHFRGAAAPVTGVDLSPSGKLLLASGVDGSTALWDVESGEQAGSLADPGDGAPGDDDGGAATRARFLDDRTVVVAPASGGLWRWEVGGPPAPQPVGDPTWSVLGISDNGRWAAVDADTTVDVVDVRSAGRRVAGFRAGAAADSATVSADGRRIVVVDEDGAAFVGDVRRGSTRSLRELAVAAEPGGDEFVEQAAVSADGRSVAASVDGELVVWDVRSREVTFRSATFAGGPVAFASAGRLVTVGTGGPLLYPLSLPGLKAMALARVARALSDEECRNYLQTGAPCTPESPGDGKGGSRG